MPKLFVIGLCGQSVFLPVPRFHQHGETLRAASVFKEPGGKGYNQAVAAARLGAEVTFLGAVGDDADGALCAARLVKEGIKPQMVIKPSASTAYAAILTDAQGETRVTVASGAAELLSTMDIQAYKDEIAQSDMLLLNGEIPRDAFFTALDLAKAARVPVALNPAPCVSFLNTRLSDYTLIAPNFGEFCALFSLNPDVPFDPVRARDAMCAHGVRRMAVTLGSQGACMITQDEGCILPAEHVAAVDATGAGDTFFAALCVRLLQGDSFTQAGKYAVHAAAHTVARPHVLDALPRAAEL